jgi:hypothetical protein
MRVRLIVVWVSWEMMCGSVDGGMLVEVTVMAGTCSNCFEISVNVVVEMKLIS